MSKWTDYLNTLLSKVDLSTLCPRWKSRDKGDTTKGQLNEYLRRLNRVREDARKEAEGHLQSLEALAAHHHAEVKTEQACEEYQAAFSAQYTLFKIACLNYQDLTSQFMKEIRHEFDIDFSEIVVVGVREDSWLVTRTDNRRGDYTRIDILLYGEKCRIGYSTYTFTPIKEEEAVGV